MGMSLCSGFPWEEKRKPKETAQVLKKTTPIDARLVFWRGGGGGFPHGNSEDLHRWPDVFHSAEGRRLGRGDGGLPRPPPSPPSGGDSLFQLPTTEPTTQKVEEKNTPPD